MSGVAGSVAGGSTPGPPEYFSRKNTGKKGRAGGGW